MAPHFSEGGLSTAGQWAALARRAQAWGKRGASAEQAWSGARACGPACPPISKDFDISQNIEFCQSPCTFLGIPPHPSTFLSHSQNFSKIAKLIKALSKGLDICSSPHLSNLPKVSLNLSRCPQKSWSLLQISQHFPNFLRICRNYSKPSSVGSSWAQTMVCAQEMHTLLHRAGCGMDAVGLTPPLRDC